MTKRSALRLLLAALLLGGASGCFVNDEINKASALDNGSVAPRDSKAPGDASKPASGAKTDASKTAAASKPAGPSGKAWWQTARSVTSEESGEGISRCQLSGGVQFMDHDDCLARGGTPK